MKLSIIIPMYKVEKYLSQCLDSIYKQDCEEEDFEIIAVNDGSPDNCSLVIKTFQKDHSNLILIEQENSGVSVARNNGIIKAQGDYVTFVDPDDIMIEHSLERCISRITPDGENLIVCRNYVPEGELNSWIHIASDKTMLTPAEYLKQGVLKSSVWGALYKNSFIKDNNIEFLPGVKNGEDTNFFLQCMFYTSYVEFWDIDLYRVLGMEESASRTFSTQRIDSMFFSIKKIAEQTRVLESKGTGNNYILQYMRYIILSNLVTDSIKTPGVNWKYVSKAGITKYTKFKIDDNIVLLRNKMKLMNTSLKLYYLLAWCSSKLAK